EIQKIALPPNHPDLATSYNNIGLVYNNMGEYSKALSSFERSLEIRKIALPANHSDLAASYNNIGMVYDNMGEYSKALSFLQKGLAIRQKSLPPNHPDIAQSKRNIEIIKYLSIIIKIIVQILIIGYLKLNIKKFQSSSRKSQRSITRTRNIGTNEQHLSIKNDKDSSIISNTNKDTEVNFERLLSTTLISIKSIKHLIILNQRSMYKRASEHELETRALAALVPVVYDLFLVETLLELVRYNKLNNFEKILNDFRQSLAHDETVYCLDIFSYSTSLNEYFKLLL
ncbi:unnamed protein product, partial [Rotaria sordida]